MLISILAQRTRNALSQLHCNNYQEEARMSDEGTIGDFRFGLKDAETHARFTESLYREVEPMNEWGALPEETTYSEIAELIIDTISNHAGMDSIPATALPTLIQDALEQLREEE